MSDVVVASLCTALAAILAVLAQLWTHHHNNAETTVLNKMKVLEQHQSVHPQDDRTAELQRKLSASIDRDIASMAEEPKERPEPFMLAGALSICTAIALLGAPEPGFWDGLRRSTGIWLFIVGVVFCGLAILKIVWMFMVMLWKAFERRFLSPR